MNVQMKRNIRLVCCLAVVGTGETSTSRFKWFLDNKNWAKNPYQRDT